MAVISKPNSYCFAAILLISFTFPLLFNAQKDAISDTLYPGEEIKDNQTLVSSAGSFELGFFSPDNSSTRYIGIWYSNITRTPLALEKTVVWVGNRDNPIRVESGAAFTLDVSGNLKVYDQSGYSFTVAFAYTKNIVLKLLDNGNLVLKDEKSGDDSEAYFNWQSFDHPTDTILPGMRFGINQAQIVSWAGNNDPSSGPFSLGYDPYQVQQLFIWQKGTLFLGSQQILDEQRIKPIPENFSAVFYFSQSELNFSQSAHVSSLYSRIVLDSTGKLNYFTWLAAAKEWRLLWTKPDDPCRRRPEYCGVFSICRDKSSYPCRCLDGFKPVIWRVGNISCSMLIWMLLLSSLTLFKMEKEQGRGHCRQCSASLLW